MLAPFLLCLISVAHQTSNVKASRLTDGSINVEWDYLPALKEHPEKAKEWKLMKVELMYDDALFGEELRTPHFAIRLTTDQTVRTDGLDNPIFYELRAPKHVEEERMTGFLVSSAWPAENRVASMTGPFPEKRDDRTTKDITLERLTECVSLEGLRRFLYSKIYGQCLLFILRVIRFVLGDCKCGACGNPKKEDMEKLQKLSVGAQARVEGDEKGLTKLLAKIKELKKQGPNKLVLILYGLCHPNVSVQETLRIMSVAKAVVEQLCSLAGMKTDVKISWII